MTGENSCCIISPLVCPPPQRACDASRLSHWFTYRRAVNTLFFYGFLTTHLESPRPGNEILLIHLAELNRNGFSDTDDPRLMHRAGNDSSQNGHFGPSSRWIAEFKDLVEERAQVISCISILKLVCLKLQQDKCCSLIINPTPQTPLVLRDSVIGIYFVLTSAILILSLVSNICWIAHPTGLTLVCRK